MRVERSYQQRQGALSWVKLGRMLQNSRQLDSFNSAICNGPLNSFLCKSSPSSAFIMDLPDAHQLILVNHFTN